MRPPRLRRGPRPRAADDDDWGTSSPAAIMDGHLPAPVPLKSDTVARVKQQDLTSYTCTFSPRCVVTLYFAIAFIFIPLGSAIVAGTSKIRTLKRIPYSEREGCAITDQTTTTCVVPLNISADIPAPSYLYYSLTNFHQNARNYAKSRSDVMNQGLVPKSMFDVQNCEPLLYTNSQTAEDDGFDPKRLLYPCGLTAWSRFNDTFQLCRDEACDTPVKTTSEGIAWKTDRDVKFRPGDDSLFQQPSNVPPTPNDQGAPNQLAPNQLASNQLTPNQLLADENFMVWMRLAAFPDFDKLYLIITEDLIAGNTYYMHINASFRVEQFRGTKGFRITTVTWFGGRNSFLGTSYMVVGVAALFIAIVLLFKHVVNPKTPSMTDPSVLLLEKIEALNQRPPQAIAPQEGPFAT